MPSNGAVPVTSVSYRREGISVHLVNLFHQGHRLRRREGKCGCLEELHVGGGWGISPNSLEMVLARIVQRLLLIESKSLGVAETLAFLYTSLDGAHSLWRHSLCLSELHLIQVVSSYHLTKQQRSARP